MTELKTGTIWKVIIDMEVTSLHGEKEIGKRKVIIKNGEILEFRYSYGVHFRTQDEKWFYADIDYFLKCCKIYGRIWEKVFFNNLATLDEIVRLRLFDKVEENELR